MKRKNNNFAFRQSSRQAGFTMIELMVTIIIIVILSTVSVVVFQNHLKSGRDSLRKTNVDSVVTMIRLNRITEEKSNYDLSKAQVFGILNNKTINIPKAQSGHEYFYGYSAKKENFFIVVCGEAESEFFVEGTPAGVMAVRSKNPTDVCDGSSVPIKVRTAPLDLNTTETNIDAYTIYKLS